MTSANPPVLIKGSPHQQPSGCLPSDTISSLNIYWTIYLSINSFLRDAITFLSTTAYFTITSSPIVTPGTMSAIFDHSTFFNDDTTANDGIFDCSLDMAAIGHHRRYSTAFIKILCRCRIIGTCIDRPSGENMSFAFSIIQQGHIGIIITLKIADTGKEAAQRNAAYV